jgi:hypothetical protein
VPKGSFEASFDSCSQMKSYSGLSWRASRRPRRSRHSRHQIHPQRVPKRAGGGRRLPLRIHRSRSLRSVFILSSLNLLLNTSRSTQRRPYHQSVSLSSADRASRSFLRSSRRPHGRPFRHDGRPNKSHQGAPHCREPGQPLLPHGLFCQVCQWTLWPFQASLASHSSVRCQEVLLAGKRRVPCQTLETENATNCRQALVDWPSGLL